MFNAQQGEDRLFRSWQAIRKNSADYPRQFWLLFWMSLISRATFSMTWPFITIFITQKLDVSLTVATLMLTIQSIASLVGAALISALMDQFGRKIPMVISLLVSAGALTGMALSDNFIVWMVLIAMQGAVAPIFITGANTMVADVVDEAHRTPAYALIRMIANAGIAIGPVVGGIIAASFSIEVNYLATAVTNILISGLMLFMLSETLPKGKIKTDEQRGGGYAFMLRDRPFLGFALAYMFVQLGYTQMFMLLPPYVTDNFGLSPSEFSLMFTVNAGMVVFLQYFVTRFTMRYRTLPIIAVGAVFYAIGIGSVAFGTTLAAFLLSMAIMTIGELIIAPTATAFVAYLAPVDMRARYMGLFGIAFPVAMGIGPVIGGMLNDAIAPVAIWYGAGLIALVGAVVFFSLSRRIDQPETTEAILPVTSGD